MKHNYKIHIAVILESLITIFLDWMYKLFVSNGETNNHKTDETADVYTNSINANIYATKPSDYQTWVDIIFNRIRLPFPLTAISFALPIFVIGLFLARYIHFDLYYIKSSPIHLGILGIIWVCLIIRYGSLSFHSAYEELRPCFIVTDEEYLAIISKWFRKLANHKGNIIFSLILALIAWLIVYISFFRLDIIQELNIASFRPTLFMGEWYSQDNLIMKAVIIALYGLYIAFPLGTAMRLLIINFRFLLDLRQLPVIPLPNVIRFRLTKITNLYITITLSWFVGVALFGILLFHELDIISIISLFALSSFGLITFFTPQVIYRILLIRSSYVSSQWVLVSFFKQFGIKLNEKNIYEKQSILSNDVGVKLANMDDLSGFIEATDLSKFWVYDPSDILLLFLGQVLALGSVFFDEVWKALFT